MSLAAIRAKLQEEASKIVEQALKELPIAIVKTIESIQHFEDNRIEVRIIIETPNPLAIRITQATHADLCKTVVMPLMLLAF